VEDHGIAALPLVMSDHTVHLRYCKLLYGSNKTLIYLYDTLDFSKKSNWFARLADQAGNSLVTTKAVVVLLRVVDKVWNF